MGFWDIVWAIVLGEFLFRLLAVILAAIFGVDKIKK